VGVATGFATAEASLRPPPAGAEVAKLDVEPIGAGIKVETGVPPPTTPPEVLAEETGCAEDGGAEIV